MEGIIMIAGIPGSGKTELAGRLHDAFGGTLISTGDIARRVDPDGVSQGKLADEAAFRAAFDVRLLQAIHEDPAPIILDGFPRNRTQMGYVEGFKTKLIALTCRPDVAVDRQMLRGRAGDTVHNIEVRTAEQMVLLEQNVADGWLYRAAGWVACINTTQKTPDQIAAGVIAYLRGEKREAF